jgi:PAS domain S-box-containing protein
MLKSEARSPSDTRLWRRILLVGVTGSAPLFVVSLLLINLAYSGAIDFGLQEQRGNAFERPLEHLFELLPRYQAAARAALAASPSTELSLPEAKRQIDEAVSRVASEYEGELGHALQFNDAALRSRDRTDARLSVLQSTWRELAQAPLEVAAKGEAVNQLQKSVRAMIDHAGDRSNLILDDDLDSYYLMDATLSTLPQSQQRIAEITLQVADWLRTGETAQNERQIAVWSEMLRQNDLERIQRDVRISLAEDEHFNGVSASLHASLPPAVERLEAADRHLLELLDRISNEPVVSAREFEAAGWAAHAESFRLFRVGADELDRLLAKRIQVIEDRRLQGYSLIVATLVAAAFGMGLLMRGLLAARYAEMLSTQEELRSKEAQLRALGDNLPGGMTYQVMRDFDGSSRFLYLSAGVERLHGVTAQAALADPGLLYDQIHPDDLGVLRAAEQVSMTRRSNFIISARTRHPSGVVRWMEFFSAPRELSDGRVVWDGVQLDVTDRKLAEAVTKQSEQRFSRIFDNSPIPITLSSFADGKFIAANDSFLKISGFEREEIIGRTSVDLGIYADLSQRELILEQLKQHGHVHGRELEFRMKSGATRQNILWIDVIDIAGDRCVLTISMDITEQKRAAQQQRELEEQLRQAQKLEAVGTLAGGIAHDFNNILSAIVSYAELSKLDNPDNLTLQENLDEVLTASARAAALVRQILSFSREQKAERVNLQLAPVIKEALSLLRATLPSTLALRQELAGPLPAVLANPTQVHQILMNLCTNAAHASRGKQGEIRVELGLVHVAGTGPKPHVELQPGDYVRLIVSDTGQGMDSAIAQRVFEPFFTTKPSGEGTGLGLSVVHGIVKDHGGVVTVSSQLGVGTTFAIFFPALAASEKQASLPATELPRGNGERVLFVDDERVLGDVAKKMMQRLGYQAVVFNSSEAALAAFQKEPNAFDALITDLTMPGLTGVDLAREALALRPALPIILVSGSSGSLTATELREMGIRELLSKPLNYGMLSRVLHQILQPAA